MSPSSPRLEGHPFRVRGLLCSLFLVLAVCTSRRLLFQLLEPFLDLSWRLQMKGRILTIKWQMMWSTKPPNIGIPCQSLLSPVMTWAVKLTSMKIKRSFIHQKRRQFSTSPTFIPNQITTASNEVKVFQLIESNRLCNV